MVVMGTIGLGAIPPLATFCRFFGTMPLNALTQQQVKSNMFHTDTVRPKRSGPIIIIIYSTPLRLLD